MAINSRYHLMLNDKGYIIADDSFAIQPQKPFNPRFSTGNPSHNDLSFWQFLVQEDFSGGEGQEIFDDTTKYLESCGWDIRDGKPRLSFPSQDAAAPAMSSTPSTLGNLAARLINWGGSLIACVSISATADDGKNDNSPGGGGGGYFPLG